MTQTAKLARQGWMMSVSAISTLRLAALGVALVTCLTACGRGEGPDLVNFKPTDGPDEFKIVPTRPLESPTDYAVLPAPTPGGTNIADPRPKSAAVAALGGNRTVLNRPSGDGALLAHTTRFGVAENIRGVLAASDAEFRRRNDGRLLERLFNVTVYYRAYRPLALDPHSELERFRRAGVRTPAAPPPATR